ncbi:DMT family transporter [Brevibacillus sp. SYSU BS000544]|uniref:DMT family transporter n=1 Tax=Brevibacillus sp. SYSU BS000544 TaxID=3416443 RepID=UPI003CE52198
MGRKQVLLADTSLLLIAIAWGYTFVLTKDILRELAPLTFTGARFLLAGLILFAFRWRSLIKLSREQLIQGGITGLLLCAAFTTQIVGIEYTTPGKAGLLTGTTVVFVPFLAYLIYKIAVHKGAMVGSFVTFCGLLLLSWDNSWSGISVGDILILFSALFFALHIIAVDRIWNENDSFHLLDFTMLQLMTVGVVDLVLASWLEPMPEGLSWYGWYAFFFDCLVGTLLAYLVQIKAQQYTPPIHVGIIMSMEAMFAVLFSWILWGEQFTPTVLFGIVLIIAAIFITVLTERPSENKQEQSTEEVHVK